MPIGRRGYVHDPFCLYYPIGMKFRTILTQCKGTFKAAECVSPHNLLILTGIYGSGGRDRTYDQLINSQLLYR